MSEGRIVCWFSCGAASAVATRMTLTENPAAVIAYCETGSEHFDNERFLADCVRWFNAPVTRLKTDRYADTWEMWEKRRFLSGVNGAGCTGEFKLGPRLDFQLPSDTHVFGYTADNADRKRADRLRETYPEMTIITPLIDAGLTKANVLALIEGAGITVPRMYKLGFHNNNCIPCVKATSPNYWALVRLEFPAEFQRMAKLSRDLGVRLTRIKDERRFIDEIPADWPCTNPIAPACDFLCQFAAEDIGAAIMTDLTPTQDTITARLEEADAAELIARFRRWMMNTGYDGGDANSPPKRTLAALKSLLPYIATLKAELEEARAKAERYEQALRVRIWNAGKARNMKDGAVIQIVKKEMAYLAKEPNNV